jgi:hypothetical protein
MSPIEANARKLVGVLAEFFPNGGSSEDLRTRFQILANRKHATYYSCLHFAKTHGWILTDGKILTLSPDGSWRKPIEPPPRAEIGEELERHQLDHVLAMRAEHIKKLEATTKRLTNMRKAVAAGEAAGPAISTLVEIMSDPTVTIRGRLAAAENLLAYKTPPDVAEHAKMFLATIFLDKDQPLDHRLAATTALRKSEDVRIMPAIERPTPPAPPRDEEAERRELEAEHARKRAHIERQAAIDAAELAEERAQMAASKGRLHLVRD